MGVKYIWDTNTVIYYLQKKFPQPAESFIDKIVNDYVAVISVITEIELFCWGSATEKDILTINQFIANCDVYELGSDVKLQTIEIRKKSRLKLPDAIIAASAIVHNKILITRNTTDFGKIPDLEIIDPFTI